MIYRKNITVREKTDEKYVTILVLNTHLKIQIKTIKYF